jgi:hypothetical protein
MAVENAALPAEWRCGKEDDGKSSAMSAVWKGLPMGDGRQQFHWYSEGWYSQN